VYEHAAAIVAIEERLFQIDQLLAAAATRGGTGGGEHCPECGSPLFPGARFCPSCGHALTAAP
jgi:uncharacterized Zn finger protein (UPF0148 family)